MQMVRVMKPCYGIPAPSYVVIPTDKCWQMAAKNPNDCLERRPSRAVPCRVGWLLPVCGSGCASRLWVRGAWRRGASALFGWNCGNGPR